MTSVSYKYQSDFARRYYGQGRAEGKAEGKVAALLTVLDARGVGLPEDMRDQISRCTDIDQLDAWIRRAATATTPDELFD